MLEKEKEVINKASDIAEKSIQKIERQLDREAELAEAKGSQAKY